MTYVQKLTDLYGAAATPHRESTPHEIARHPYTSVSLFSGGGGMDVGLDMAGFRLVTATDFVPAACETVKFNFPAARVVCDDIQRLSAHDLVPADIAGVDLLCGGPPCQAFTILGRRKSFGDPRGALVFDYVRLVKEVGPRAFLFENVKGLKSVNKGQDWKALLQYFWDETGYRIFETVLNAAHFGVPQFRERVFVVGFKSTDVSFRFPIPTHGEAKREGDFFCDDLHPFVTVREAFEGLDESTPNHVKRIHGERVATRYSKIPPGGRDKVDHTDRLEWDRPSGTVLVGSSAGGGRPHIHPEEHRHITAREAARLQSFPDGYVFQRGSTAQYRQIGNAVPPLLAYAIGNEIKKSIKAPATLTHAPDVLSAAV